MTDATTRCLLTVDVEDWFQVENLAGAITRDSWHMRELRVEQNVDTILSMLSDRSTKGTFFVLGWIAENAPGVIRRIHAEGHEIASHGYGHELVYRLSQEQFRADLLRSKGILEDLTGSPVIGYRAPTFSITDWAVRILMECGFRYDSSVFPTIAHDRYGRLKDFPLSDSSVYEMADGFYQVLLSCLPLFRKNIPWSGGGYFRMIPYPVFRWGVQRILRQKGTYCFYIHPWEFDPGQPRIKNIRAGYRFRHYRNIEKTKSRFIDLLHDFKFQPIRTILPGAPAGGPERGGVLGQPGAPPQ